MKLLLDNGVPRDHIIHFAYDDVAYDRDHCNPFPGKLFNKPSMDVEGENVYDYNEIDYRGSDVNKLNFLAALLGDPKAEGPALRSTKDSKVFLYMVGHGSSGVVPMPEGHAEDWLYADELNQAINRMKEKELFKELLIYMDTDESGSMFPYLKAHDNVIAVTSARPAESSWASYCGTEAIINGHHMGTCLGTRFSTNWMENSEQCTDENETLNDQIHYT